MPTMPSLPPAMTPWHMFLNADIVVQSVMLLLLTASVATWTIFFAKGALLLRERRRLAAGLRMAEQGGDLSGQTVAAALQRAAAAELEASADLPAEGTKDRIAIGLHRVERAMIRRLRSGTGLLASIGSCAPFVGLFGTVWGIMNSFVGISQSQTTNLAVVAPGIAEALLATAFGLGAAIPAVLIHNLFARALAGYRMGLGDLASVVLVRAARDVDRMRTGGAATAARRPVLVRGAAE